MEDFKSKRKNQPRNPYLFLGAGISIGVLLTLVVAGVFFFIGQRQMVIVPAPTQVPFYTDLPNLAIPTEAPVFNGQGIQATVIAPRVQAAAVSPDGRYLATTATDTVAANIILHELWVDRNLGGEQTVLYTAPAGNYFDDILFSPDGTRLLATINYGIALLFDVENRVLLDEYPNIGGAAFSADGSILAVVGANNGIRLIDTKSLTIVASTSHQAYQVGAVAISSKNELAIALDNRVEIYEIEALLNTRHQEVALPQVYEVNSSFAYDLAFHPSGDYLAISGDGFVQVLSLQDNSRTNYNFSTPYIYALAFSPSGNWLAVAGGESGYAQAFLSVFRWDDSDVIPPDPAFYAPINLTGHEHTVFDVAFTPDDYLLSASWDGTVRLWDLNTREEISKLHL